MQSKDVVAFAGASHWQFTAYKSTLQHFLPFEMDKPMGQVRQLDKRMNDADLLRLMVSRNGSDLFLTADFPPAIKVDGKITKVSPQPLTGQHTMALARSVMNDKQAAEFERTKECSFAISPTGVGRFRIFDGKERG